MRVPTSLDHLRFWLSDNASALVLLAATVAIAAASLLIFQAIRARGPVEMRTGTVIAFGLLQTEIGGHPRAVIQLADRQVVVFLQPGHTCAVGSSIEVRQTPTLFGDRHSAPLGCRMRRP